MMKKRAEISFTADADIWSTVEKWAGEHKYNIKTQSGSKRLFQKGVGFWVAPTMLEIEVDGNRVQIEAWIRINLFTRLFSLFILPAEITIESGGVRAAVPRRIARKAVNKLLIQLNQPEIT